MLLSGSILLLTKTNGKMFIVNEEILSKKNTPELYSWYEKQVKEIQDAAIGNYVVFSSFKKPHWETDENGRRRKIERYKSIPPTSTIDVPNIGTVTWTYIPGTNSVKYENGAAVPVNLKPFYIGQDHVYHKVNDRDIIFFLLKCSEALKNKKLFHVDYRKNSIEEAEASALASEAQMVVFHADSPISVELSGSEDALRQIAISFGVTGVDSLHIAEVRNELWKIIQYRENTKDKGVFGYKGVIDAAGKVKNAGKRAVILTGIEKGILRYEDLKWYLHVKGSFDKPICSVQANDVINAKEVVIKYVLENTEYLDLITEAIKSPEEKLVKEEPLEEKPERSDLIDGCMRLGWKKGDLYKMKSAKLQEIIANEIKPE